jgi:putative FmdB family regulatory protein
MPLYEYECVVCAHRFERIQRVSDDPVASCPVCGGEVHRLLSAPALQFKGSGWYVTDYGKGSGSRGGNGKGPSASETGDAKAPPKKETAKTAADSAAKGD